MQKNKKSIKFDWLEQSDGVYVQKSRLEQYDDNRFISVGDIYFRFNKYLTGVTYTYVNSLDDVYKKSLMTGDGYSIINMYNEYDVIDRVLKNSIFVDVASDTDIDLTKQWLEINGVKLKPQHLVLLKNQLSDIENDVYVVSNKHFLMNSNVLNTRDKSDKFSCNVKLGKNVDKHFFLSNVDDLFPITGESKQFIEGKSFILKNLIKYDLDIFYTDYSNAAKIFFTDYDVARKQLVENSEKYDYFSFDVDVSYFPIELVKIKYHHDLYIIRCGEEYKYTGFTDMTYNISNKVENGYTSIPYPVIFDVVVGDYIKLNIYSGTTINSGSTILLTMSTFIKNIKNINGIDYIILEENLPNRILANLKNYIFSVENLNVATVRDWAGVFNKLKYSPYSDYFRINTTDIDDGFGVEINAISNVYDKYFDYDGLFFSFNKVYIDDPYPPQDDENNWHDYNFITYNQYISYKLYDNLNRLDTVFTSGYTIYNEYLLTGFTYEYTDNNRIRIIDNSESLYNNFKEYTYVNISGNTLTGRTLIYSVHDHEMIIEKPSSFPSYPETQIISIQNIDGLKNISDILYEVYMNDTYDWYIKKIDNERKYICRAYAEILVLDNYFRKMSTGILFENENNEFILKLFDLGSNISGGIDNLLYFSTIELVYIGTDRKTRFPVPLSLLSLDIVVPQSPRVIEYGRLYNWYAATDSRHIAPVGWHVPTDAEWTVLTTYLGGVSVAGGKLIESGTTHWISTNSGVTNIFGFSGLPGGFRTPTSVFSGIELETGWWTSTIYHSENSYRWSINHSASSWIVRAMNDNLYGLSIRLIKDTSDNEGDVIIDGDTYNTVTIGTQVWLKQNLATTHYRNGDPILSDFSVIVGAVTAYDNDESNV